ACGSHAPPQVVVVPSPTPAPEVSSPLVGVLDGVGMMLLLPRERQEQEVAALSAGLASADLPTDRLQLALLLVLGDEAVRDADRAAALLEDRSWNAAGYETLARLVLDLLEERTGHASDKLDAAIALEQERKARKALEERLEAIKAIETEIDARELGADVQ
ncbi:MAG: hypothetical protein ABMB14_32905, partial [Myxococcota bacterium]